ncbi:hypothetical protein KIN20_020251 [Parelaphostrongylus tenuis]|uniref:Uncharacterized protein n=1 Tax=Parelaphostrongylus tenuis TaxID=148309 RepID=A0AAD5QTI7_PARTN|nr:hypothetical protein KIN20_020251 [Parelaphostrongylus tenuis]
MNLTSSSTARDWSRTANEIGFMISISGNPGADSENKTWTKNVYISGRIGIERVQKELEELGIFIDGREK